MSRDERRWLTGTNPLALLRARHPVHTLGSLEPQKRPCRMYLIACARQRRVWHRLPGVCRALVELAEAYADEQKCLEELRPAVEPVAGELMHSEGSPDDLVRAETHLLSLTASESRSYAALVRATLDRARRLPAATAPAPLAPDEWRGLAILVYLPFDTHTPTFSWVPTPLHSADMVREVYGNPYRHVNFELEWRTSNVVALARSMYQYREFSAMPILADALQDAGCNDPAILDHCRDPRRAHARGCWVLDQVLDLR
jgi:hypothetical protein